MDECGSHRWRKILSLKFYHRHLDRQDVRDKSIACERRPTRIGVRRAVRFLLPCIIAAPARPRYGRESAMNILNIAAYKFVALDHLRRAQPRLAA
jgi:hypothetical protein